MELYNRNIMPFDAYLDIKSRKEPNDALARATMYQINSMSKGFGAVVANQQIMTGVMALGFTAVTRSIEKTNRTIEALRSDFNWTMGEVLSKLEIQGETLQQIAETLQAPLATQARELRGRAQFAYQNEWYHEALADFLEAEKQNYQDFIVHQSIANIYLYHSKPNNLEKAREYYLKAAKYAFPVSKYDAALAYMFAGFVCYLQEDNGAAIQYAAKAASTYPKLVEAHFNHAKFAAAAGQANVAIPSLETAIRIDRNYAIKARADSDFEAIEVNVTVLIERLRDEMRQTTETKIRELQKVADVIKPESVRSSVRDAISKASAILLNSNTYFDCCAAMDAVSQLAIALAGKIFYHPRLVVSLDTVVVDGKSVSTKNLKPVRVEALFTGWKKTSCRIALLSRNNDFSHTITTTDFEWAEAAANAINQAIAGKS